MPSFGLIGIGWQIKLALVIIPAVLVIALCVGLRFPPTERKARTRQKRERWKTTPKAAPKSRNTPCAGYPARAYTNGAAMSASTRSAPTHGWRLSLRAAAP